MSFFSFFRGQKKPTASLAKERLQLIIAHERSSGGSPDYLPQLQKELVDVISKYVKINPEDISVNLERQDTLEVLEVKIELSPQDKTEAKTPAQPCRRRRLDRDYRPCQAPGQPGAGHGR